ncbi:MAG: exosome complex protein Rrp42 [Nanoarchaeota archaeon]
MGIDSIKAYMSELLKKGQREDGRKVFDYRKIEIEVNPLARACGSARVRIGETEVLVGVKMDVATPYPDSPDDGTLIVNAELIPLANPDFEPGPPSPQSVELARVVDRGIRESGAIDTAKLCIKPKEKVWCVFIDIYPMNDDGNLLDAAALGAIVALKHAYLPKYDEKENKVLYKELTKEKLPLTCLPVMTTFGKLDGQVFLDASRREERSYDGRLSIATLENGTISAMQKGEAGTFTEKEVFELLGTAIEKGKELRGLIKKA